MAVDYDVLVPIPSDANHPKTSTRVFITTKKHYDPDKKHNRNSRVEIGKAVSRTEMHPNTAYKQLFSEIYNEYAPYKKQLPAMRKIIGPYSVFLAIGQHTELYPVLVKSFGPKNANMIMDYAIYSILTHSNVAKDFQATMKDYLLFSSQAYSDSWLSDFFSNKLTDKMGMLFRNNWIRHCREAGITETWLCIDGSNDDCDAENVFEAECGHDKSRNGGPVVSYMWAVSSKDGTPVTYFAYRGSRVDSVALKEMVAYLSEFGITTQGVILDRGFWNIEDLECLRGAGLDFVIMMKGGVGYRNMLLRHGATLRSQDVHHMLKKSGQYGIVDRVRVFTNLDEEYCIGLFYDNVRAAKKANELTDKIKAVFDDISSKIKEGSAYTISSEMSSFITATKHPGRRKDSLAVNYEKLQDAVNGKGFAAMVMSTEMTAQELDNVYSLRQQSEKQYAAFKSQLGYDVMRVYSSDSWHSKFACGFAAGILRNEYVNRCVQSGIDANKTMKELSFIAITQIRERHYVYVNMMSLLSKVMYTSVGLNEDDMKLISEAENNRLQGGQVHPVHHLPKRETIRRKAGRPVGSKDKKPRTRRSSGKTTKDGS